MSVFVDASGAGGMEEELVDSEVGFELLACFCCEVEGAGGSCPASCARSGSESRLLASSRVKPRILMEVISLYRTRSAREGSRKRSDRYSGFASEPGGNASTGTLLDSWDLRFPLC